MWKLFSTQLDFCGFLVFAGFKELLTNVLNDFVPAFWLDSFYSISFLFLEKKFHFNPYRNDKTIDDFFVWYDCSVEFWTLMRWNSQFYAVQFYFLFQYRVHRMMAVSSLNYENRLQVYVTGFYWKITADEYTRYLNGI